MQDATFNPQDKTVTYETMFDGPQTVTYTEAYARGFVVQHLSHTGSYKSVLNPAQWEQAYLMCDGFGQVDKAWAQDQCWDWSHVRDSNIQTFVRVANWIAAQKWHLGNIQAIADNMIEQCNRVGIDPIEAIP